MLLRNAGHKLASPISLDFLAPSLFSRRTASTKAALNLRAYNGSNKPNLASMPAASSSSMYSPATLLNKLDQQLQVFHEQLVGAPTDSQVEIFSKVIPELRRAHENLDVTKACNLWLTLKTRNLLAFSGPSHHDMFSRFVASACGNNSDHCHWDQSETDTLEEIAVVTASGGAIDGLKAYMLSCIKRGDSDKVIHLYHCYLSHLEQKDPLREVEGRTQEEANGEDENDASVHLTTGTSASTLVRSDILLFAITTYVMQDSFAEALRTTLQVFVRISPAVLGEFLQNLDDDPALRDKVALYIPRLETARLLARPGAFARQMANLTRDHADKSLEGLYESIIEGISDENPWLAPSASLVTPQQPVVMPEFAWASFITGFLRCRRMDLAEKLWDDMLRLGIQPGVSAWNALIAGYAELRAVETAMTSWNVMQTQGVKPDAMTYRAIIQAFFNASQPDEAMKRFHAFKEALPKLSPPPEESTVLVVYNTVIHGLLFHQREADAQKLLQRLQIEGPKPDIVTFNNFLRYHSRQGALNKLADVLEMIEPAGLVGDVFTFSIVLSALLKVRADAAQIVIGFMKKQGVEPNAATISAIIDHQMKAQTESSFRAALDLLTTMEQSSSPEMQPNEVTYTTILTGMHRGNWLQPAVVEEYRQVIWDKIETRDIHLNRVTYNILIRACLENKELTGIQHAMRYYRDMVKRRIFIANDTWYILLLGLIKREEWSLAQELVEDIRRNGFVPAGALSELVVRVRKRANQKVKSGPASYI